MRAYKERNLSEFENVPVEEEKVVPVAGGWVVVVEEAVEEATWILLLQVF